LRETTATNGALLNSVTPVLILLLSRLLFGERLSLMQVLGVSISLLGVAVILMAGDYTALAALHLNRGDLWVLLATLAWAIYTVCLRWRPVELNLLAMLWVIAAIGVCAMAPFYAWEIASGRTMNPTTEVLGALLYIGALSTVVSYVFWNRAVQQIGPNRAGPFMYLMIVYTPLLAIVFIGERLHLYHVIGCALILGGIYLTNRGRAATAPVEEAPDL
jgi:drug/metabolite transporter (DMT)-like permease